MSKTSSIVELLTVSMATPIGSGFSSFKDRLPNGRKVSRNGVPAAIGHVAAGGMGPTTEFGRDFKAAGLKWTKDFCNRDSDGDGQSNGLELGDEHCVWVMGGSEPCRTTDISDPSVSASLVSTASKTTKEECMALAVGPQEVKLELNPSMTYETLSTRPWATAPMPGMHFSWKIEETNDSFDVLGTFNYTGDTWVSVGLKSHDQVEGALILCYVYPDGLHGAVCEDFEGHGWHFVPSPKKETTVMSSHIGEGVDGVNQVTFRRRAAHKNGTALGDVAWDVAYRTIWSQGPVRADGHPLLHDGQDTDAALINFRTGSVERYWSVPLRGYLGMFIIIALLVIAIVVVQVQHFTGIQMHHTCRTVFGIVWSVLLFGALALNVVLRTNTYYEIAWFAPLTRSMGDTAGLLLAGQLLSAGRRFFFQDLLSVSHERAMAYHAVMGILMVVATVWHGIGMWHIYFDKYNLRWSWGTRVNPLAGVLAALFLIPVVLPSLLRFRGSYKVFRLTHGFWVVVVIFSCLHSRSVLYVCLPGIANLVFGFLYGLYINRNARCEEISRDEASGTVTILVARAHSEWCASGKAKNIGVAPGSWFYLRAGEASYVVSHPISVARCELVTNSETNATEQHMQFIVKTGYKKQNWSTKLYNAVHSTFKPSPFCVDGPFGRLQLPLEHYKHIVLVSGGIGVTPNLFIMQHLAAMAEEQRFFKRTVKWQTVHWIHVNRDEHLLPVYSAQLEKDIEVLATCGVIVTVTTYITKKYAGANGPDVEVEMNTASTSRPKWLVVGEDKSDARDGPKSLGTEASVVMSPKAGSPRNSEPFPSCTARPKWLVVGADKPDAPRTPGSKSLTPECSLTDMQCPKDKCADSSEPFAASDMGTVIRGQRPDLTQMYNQFAEQRPDGEAAAVYNCGPLALIESSEKAAGASTGAYHVHSEVFEI